MDQPPAPSPPPKSSPLPLLFVAIGGAGCLGVLLLGGILAWIFWPSRPEPVVVAEATAATSTARASQDSVIGNPGSAIESQRCPPGLPSGGGR